MPSPVAWNFRYMHEEPCEFQCTVQKLLPYFSRLKSLEGRTRSEIEGAKNSNHGWDKRRIPSRELRVLIASTPILNDVNISQLELSGACRAFGFYRDNIFHFVFLDERHQACPMRKR